MSDSATRITPIFLFSLPRSGSTLTQRILGSHPAIATAAEPWILMPLFYAIKAGGFYSEYAHRVAHKAIEDFCADLPGGIAAYLEEVRALALHLYERKAQPNSKFFLDKTPRYHVISAEIMRSFPEAPVIFLWRNPLAIVSSIIETWGKGLWNLYEFDFDMYDGLESLLDTCRHAGDRAIAVKYEDLVAGDESTWSRLFGYLGLVFDESVLTGFTKVALPGRMGDQIGRRSYGELSLEPTAKWKRTLASPVRKWWCRRYLRWIGRDRLKLMGYDFDELLGDLDSIPKRFETIPFDLLRMLFGLAVRTFEPWIVRDKLARLRRGQRLRAHS